MNEKNLVSLLRVLIGLLLLSDLYFSTIFFIKYFKDWKEPYAFFQLVIAIFYALRIILFSVFLINTRHLSQKVINRMLIVFFILFLISFRSIFFDSLIVKIKFLLFFTIILILWRLLSFCRNK